MMFEKYFPKDMCVWLLANAENATDITLAAEKRMFVSFGKKIVTSPFFVTKELLCETVMKMCKGSLYANQKSLRAGYVTLEGGHRTGFAGTVVNENGKAAYMRDITAINVRIARDVKGAANGIMKYIDDGERVYNTVIVSPPSMGKTTALRDAVRQLGNRMRVGIADERCEIAHGRDVGNFGFAIEECSKAEGMMMLLRAMAPQVIAVDEIGGDEDEKAIEKLVNAGVKIVCTAHGYDEKDIMRRRVLANLINEGVFERIIVLSDRCGPGTVENVICAEVR